MKSRFTPEAAAEFVDAVDYYDRLLAGLGAEFAAEVSDGVDRIEEYPEAWQSFGPRTRRYRLRRFPYGLVYRLLDASRQNCPSNFHHAKSSGTITRIDNSATTIASLKVAVAETPPSSAATTIGAAW